METEKKWIIAIFLTSMVTNPFLFSIVINQLKITLTDTETFALGLYVIVWGIMMGVVFLPKFYKLNKKYYKRQREEAKPRTMDEIIDDCWREHDSKDN